MPGRPWGARPWQEMTLSWSEPAAKPKTSLMPTETTWGEGQCWCGPWWGQSPEPLGVRVTVWYGGRPTWMSGPQSTLSGVVSLWVSERPSVMTRAMRLFGVGGSSRLRVYCRASPVKVPPPIHCSFLMALQGHSTIRVGTRSQGARGQGQGQIRARVRGQGPRGPWAMMRVQAPSSHTHSLRSWALLMLGSLRSTCSCIWLWLYCTTPACDCPGSNCSREPP